MVPVKCSPQVTIKQTACYQHFMIECFNLVISQADFAYACRSDTALGGQVYTIVVSGYETMTSSFPTKT